MKGVCLSRGGYMIVREQLLEARSYAEDALSHLDSAIEYLEEHPDDAAWAALAAHEMLQTAARVTIRAAEQIEVKEET